MRPVPAHRRLWLSLTTVAATIATMLAAAGPASATDPGAVVISEFMAANATTNVDSAGAASDWVELHNTTATAVDLAGWALTDNAANPQQWVFPSITLAPDEYLLVWPTGTSSTTGELHTNFKLSASGEYLGLRDPSGTVMDEYAPTFPVQYTDISYGRSASGVGYFATATPGAANGATYAGFVTGTVAFSVPHGFYSTSQHVTMTTTQAGAQIRYTTDGSTPSQTNGSEYTGAIEISATTTLRATAVVAGFKPGPVTTASYVFASDVITQDATPPSNFPTSPINGQVFDYGMDASVVDGHEQEVKDSLTSIPSISIVTDSANLFDPTTGIYVNPAQKGSAWERPASMELIDPTGAEPGFTIDTGIRIKGGVSRNTWFPRHSFKFTFSNSYGGKLNYPLFGTDGASTYSSIELKTDNNYSFTWGNTHTTLMRDQFSRQTKAAMGQPTTRSHYVHVYLNGQYWGLYFTQEPFKADYAASYLGGSASNYDVITDDRDLGFAASAEDGTITAWNAMFPLIADKVVTDAEYASLSAQVDMANLIDTAILEAYTGNYDGAPSYYLGDRLGNNWAAMRDRTGGKWTFFADDMEHTLGSLYHQTDMDRTGPYVAFGQTYTEQIYFHPGWLHEALMSNAQYQTAFMTRARSLLTDATSALAAGPSRNRWNALAGTVRPAILAETARWSDYSSTNGPTPTDWENEVAWVDQHWFDQRPATVLEQLRWRTSANVALGKATSASSRYDASNYPPEAATDGVVSSGFVSTAYESVPYWQVDLGKAYDLTEVALYNRTDCCQQRLTGAHVLTSPMPITGRTLSEALAQSGVRDHVLGTDSSRLLSVLAMTDTNVRYIRVQLPGTDILNFGELAVHGTPSPVPTTTNLAQGKTASQSSTSWGGSPERAVDGNTDGHYWNNSVSNTDYQTQPWWQVDLGQRRWIETVDLWNRTDCCASRLADVHVLTSDAPITGTTLSAALAQPGVIDHPLPGVLGRQTTVSIGATARYVRVMLQGTGYLTLAEVQVLGSTATVTNASQGKEASEVSTGWDGVAGRAVDGNTDGSYWNLSVAHTNWQAQPWWQVDLGTPQKLASVFLWNRTDCCSSRLADVHVFASESPITGTTVAQVRALPGVTEKVLTGVQGRFTEVTGLGQARYLRIMLEGTNYLQLAEVQAFALSP